MNRDMQIKTGKCHSVPTILDNGKIELSEKWEWTSGDYSKGISVLVEVQDTMQKYYDVYHAMPTYHNPSGRKAYIMNMYTAPEYRKQGITYRTLYLLV